MFNIPIITYHKISNNKEPGLTTISISRFETHLKLLQSQGYSSITFKDLKEKRSIPAKPIIITFDDGYQCVYKNALPLLQKHNFRAVIYMVSGHLGKMNTWEAYSIQRRFKHLDRNEILDLNNNGFEIASHSNHHHYLPSCPDSIIGSEVKDSKKTLEDITGDHVISFCYPYGKYSERIAHFVQDAGYYYATCNISLSNRNGQDNYALQRRSIYYTDSVKNFIDKINKPFKFSTTVLAEWIIQKGSLAGIVKKKIQNINH